MSLPFLNKKRKIKIFGEIWAEADSFQPDLAEIDTSTQ
jgi:hypothetical protein